MTRFRIPGRLAGALVLAAACTRAPAPGAVVPARLPATHAPPPTTAAISAGDLMTRLYLFADDSMLGRETGTVGHLKSTQYIADELARLGLQPAGDRGGWFQDVPMYRRAFDPASTIRTGDVLLHGGTDFIAGGRGAITRPTTGEVVFGGVQGDTTVSLGAGQVRGRIVVFAAPAAPIGFGLLRSPAFRRLQQTLGSAAATVVVAPEGLTPAMVRTATNPPPGNVMMRGDGTETPSPVTITATRQAAEAIFGAPLAGAQVGQAGRPIQLDLRFSEEQAPARNVVAILPGSDPVLRQQYVAIGAHTDHVGYNPARAVDHDSLHLYNAARFAISGLVPRGTPLTPEQQRAIDGIRINLDSVRALRPVRRDSIFNGADDDGSGSVTTLELAEAFALSPEKPKRSILFVFHTGEEKGLLGSEWYTDHPTVPRDSIVAQLNMDMVGRGEARDIPGGGPQYLQLVGSRRLSTQLGELVEAVNAKQPLPFMFDYRFDANGHPENIYCRSDHYSYARYGIPVTFFTTGLHGDYHQVTDEPSYIAYPHMARVGQLVYDVALAVANNPQRPVVDQPKPDPKGACRQ
ncbi:MAG: M28 family metallopeptidase [Gemmatimonadaceae bacterium]